jgi:hypothetical protein
MGYDFAQAVADVVDNAIEAGATLVAIDIEFDGDDSWVRIADNGKGMKPEALREAMRFGAERDYEIDDLGKFGLGLKTASLSQCQCLSVASRWNPDRADISGYSWDLDHIQKTNRWEILPIERNGLGPSIREPLKDSPGTVVLWRRLDRLLGYRHPYGEASRKRLLQMCREVEVHLGMVFHRFLAGEVPRKRLKLLVNGNPVASWDPFCRTEVKTQVLHQVVIPLEHEGVRGDVVLDPYVLPPQSGFSTKAAADAAAGPANWNQQQGFYIYRAERMIQSGGWSNLRAPDEHTKLARVSVRFSPALDEAFKINVAKMRVQLPAAIRDGVREAVAPVIKLAREVYDRKPVGAGLPQSRGSTSPAPALTSAIGAGSTGNGMPTGPTVTTLPAGPVLLTADEWAQKMRAAATDEELPVVDAVLARVQAGNGSPP